MMFKLGLTLTRPAIVDDAETVVEERPQMPTIVTSPSRRRVVSVSGGTSVFPGGGSPVLVVVPGALSKEPVVAIRPVVVVQL